MCFFVFHKSENPVKKILKTSLISLLILFALLILLAVLVNKRLPEPEYSKEADELAEKMLDALNKDAWDSLNYIQWTFYDKHHYVWDKRKNVANIKYKTYEVVLDLDTQKGMALKDGVQLSGEELDESLQTAWKYWCNDSFWMYAPFKIFDDGVRRGIVKNDKGESLLMMSFDSGGVTPGDSYLWELDENYIPVSWQMWVKILPIGGLKTSWSDWKELDNNIKIATLHKNRLLSIRITNIKSGQNISDLGLEQSIFNYNSI